MYKCLDCGKTFDEPKTMSAEAYYGVGSMFDYACGKKMKVCPFCEGMFEEIEEESEKEEFEKSDLLDETTEID